jgi:hypothetical protein
MNNLALKLKHINLWESRILPNVNRADSQETFANVQPEEAKKQVVVGIF